MPMYRVNSWDYCWWCVAINLISYLCDMFRWAVHCAMCRKWTINLHCCTCQTTFCCCCCFCCTLWLTSEHIHSNWSVRRKRRTWCIYIYENWWNFIHMWCVCVIQDCTQMHHGFSAHMFKNCFLHNPNCAQINASKRK